LGEEKKSAAKAEIEKLLEVRFIQEEKYTTWLAGLL